MPIKLFKNIQRLELLRGNTRSWGYKLSGWNVRRKGFYKNLICIG